MSLKVHKTVSKRYPKLWLTARRSHFHKHNNMSHTNFHISFLHRCIGFLIENIHQCLYKYHSQFRNHRYTDIDKSLVRWSKIQLFHLRINLRLCIHRYLCNRIHRWVCSHRYNYKYFHCHMRSRQIWTMVKILNTSMSKIWSSNW